MRLLDPSAMPGVAGAAVPQDVYLVAREPASLAGMAYPSWDGLSWPGLAALGVRGVVCLTDEVFPYDPSPLVPFLAIRLQDLVGGVAPDDPGTEERRVRQAALAVLDHLRRGEGVLVQCAGGTGRTGTVIGCALRGLGHDSRSVLGYLDRLHKARGRDGWPESGWQAKVVESFGP
jgi:hypothetical protein